MLGLGLSIVQSAPARGVFPVSMFVATFNTTNPGTPSNTLTIPIDFGAGQNYTIIWGDGNEDTYTTGGDKTHVYAAGGIKMVCITGTWQGLNYGIAFDNSKDRNKIVKIDHFGNEIYDTLAGRFCACSNLTIPAANGPGIDVAATDAQFLFTNCFQLGSSGFSGVHWDWSNVLNFDWSFAGTTSLLEFGEISNKIQLTSCVDLFRTFFQGKLQKFYAETTTALTALRETFFETDLDECPDLITDNVVDLAATFALTNIPQMLVWNTSKVEDWEGTYFGCGFLGFLGEIFPVLDFSAGTNGLETFDSAANIRFAGPLDLSGFTVLTDFLQNAVNRPWSCEDYDSVLNNLANNNINNGLNFHAGNSRYSATGEVDRDTLVTTKSWVVSDGGIGCDFDDNGDWDPDDFLTD